MLLTPGPVQTVRAAAGAGRGLRDPGHQLGAAQAGAGGLRGQVDSGSCADIVH